MGQSSDQSGCGCCLVLYILAAFSFPILWIPLILVLVMQVRNWLMEPPASGQSYSAGDPMSRPRPTSRSSSAGSAAKAGSSQVRIINESSSATKTDPLTGEAIEPWTSYVECTACGARYSPDSYRFVQEEHNGRCQVCRNLNRYRWHAPSSGPAQTQTGQQTQGTGRITWHEQHAIDAMTGGNGRTSAGGTSATNQPMTGSEARRLLGVSASAAGYEIRRAYAMRIRELLDRDPGELRAETRENARLLDRALWTLLNQEAAS